MRAIWKGSISFGLVNVPISLYPATRAEELKFHLLRRSDLSPIKYQRVAEADDREVPWDQIVKGYEYEKGNFVPVTDEDFRRANLAATQTIQVLEFVRLAEIDPVFFDRPYYLEPQKPGAHAYALLREALEQLAMVGIAKVVLKTRQHLAAVKPEPKALVLELLHFPEELVSPATLRLPADLRAGERELQMANELIERMSDHWQPDKYHDDYRHSLLELIEKKVAAGGRSPSAKGAPAKRPGTKVIDLMSVLQQSLQQAGKKKSPGRKPVKTRKSRRDLKKAA